jgi:hypothetical protein
MPDECMVNYDLGMMTLVAATIILTTIMLRTMMMTRTLASTKTATKTSMGQQTNGLMVYGGGKSDDGDSEGDGNGHHETTTNGLKTMTGEEKNEGT